MAQVPVFALRDLAHTVERSGLPKELYKSQKSPKKIPVLPDPYFGLRVKRDLIELCKRPVARPENDCAPRHDRQPTRER